MVYVSVNRILLRLLGVRERVDRSSGLINRRGRKRARGPMLWDRLILIIMHGACTRITFTNMIRPVRNYIWCPVL